MKIFNLDNDFKPYGEGESYSKFEFPSGCEPHIKITPFASCDVLITARIKNCNDILLLLLMTDALKRNTIKSISLFISFLPFARQDRVMTNGEPLSIKVLADILNAQNYESVKIYDPHSEVSIALINNSYCVTNHSFVSEILKDKKGYFIISADAGAYKKIFKLAQYIGYKDEIILCNKIRNVITGAIESVTCPINDFQGFDVFIVDDICDGGGTFTMLANELRRRNNVGSINLIVTHGIFSKGIDALYNLDHIYTTNSVKDIPIHSKLTQITLTDGLLS